MPARTIRMRQMREIVRLEGAEVKIGIAFDWHLEGNIPFATDVLKRPRSASLWTLKVVLSLPESGLFKTFRVGS